MDEIRRLYDFNRWANLRFLDAVAALSEEELTRDMHSSFPTVLDTLVHAMGAEWVWLDRWMGVQKISVPDASELTSVDAVRARWDGLWSRQQAFLDGLEEADMARVVAWRSMAGGEHSGRLDGLLRHVVNHATYHRGQLTTLLRQLGHPAPATDLVLFYMEEGE